MKLRGMTVLITGAASGIGHALSLGFLEDGASVMAIDRQEEGLKPLEDKGALIKVADVSDPAQVDGMVEEAVSRTDRLDVLINNAGVGILAPFTEYLPGQFEEIIRINLFGPYYGMRAAISIMREQGFGRIINLLSRGAEGNRPGMAAYGSSKAGLFALTRYGAAETRDDEADILINGLIPGITKTGMMPQGQDPSAVYPTARMLALLPAGGPSGRVFWDEKEYFLFDTANKAFQR
jgi:NAD(P)-dependent dehydrogenase (short-subunit alcohol dehydrogenase family)